MTIKKLFFPKAVERMTDWEKQFIESLKNAHYQWSVNQIEVLKKIEKKYANHKTKNQDTRNTR